MERKDLYRLAQAIKERRKALGLNLEDLASRAGVSKSLISKIENYRTIPSLPVIMRIAKGIKSTLSDLAFGIEDEEDSTYILVRKNERQKFEKEESSGFVYQSLVMRNINSLLFETSILTLEPGAKRQPVSSDGYEFLYVIKGSIEFLLGSEKIILSEEDAFFFDGRVPHVPINNSNEPVEYLVVYLIEQSKEE